MAICVLTGDIVGSMRLHRAQFERVQLLLEDSYYDIKEDTSGSLDQFRGDGWQMAFDNRHESLRFALYIRATLKANDDDFDTRIAISESDAEYLISNDYDDVYVASGRALDDMPRDTLMAHANGGALHATTLLVDQISREWTQAQARAIKPFLLRNVRHTQKSVAAALGISRQAVGQALEAACYPVISRALRAIEEQAK